jgi:hypothetical protein
MDNRSLARDNALRLLNRITVGAALAAIAGVGVFGAVSAATIPGATSDVTPVTTTDSSSETSSSSSSQSSSDLQASSGVSQATSPGHATTGASH